MADTESGKRARKPSMFMFLAVTSALFGAIAMGTVLGWNSPAGARLKDLESKPRLTDDTKQIGAWISSSATIGALVGALASGPIAQILGRKMALIIYGVPMVVGYAAIWLAPNFALIIIGRVIVGLSAGLISGTAPSYVVEVSTENVRGMMGAGFQLSVTIGILYVFVFGSTLDWSYLSLFCIFPGLAMSVLMIFMPETPFWLMTKSGGDHSKGSNVEKALKKLRAPDNDNDSELKDISETTATASQSKRFTMEESKNPLFYKPFILALLLMFFQQFSGINAVMFNAEKMLKDAGSSLEPKVASIIIGVAQVIATLVGTQLVDRLGRKMLLIGSSVGHAISLGMLGIYYLAELESRWLPILCLVVFIISFSLGWGPIPWLMIAEITPMEFRSIVSAVSTALNWTCAFFITHFFEYIQDETSKQFLFFFFTFFCVVSIPFVVVFLPETKGKPFDEILRHFAKDVPAAGEGTPSASNAMLKDSEKIEMKGMDDKK